LKYFGNWDIKCFTGKDDYEKHPLLST
jgi:hypothetical protein